MSSEREPPRFRALGRALPAELVRALEPSPDEEASPAELERLSRQVRARVAAERAPAPRSGRPRRAVFQGTLGLAVTFALGAGAGVLVSVAFFLSERRTVPSEPQRTTSRSNEQQVRRATGAGAEAITAPRNDEAPAAVASTRSPQSTKGGLPTLGAASAEPPLPPSAEGKEAELGLVARAQAALASDPGKALALTSDHERKFPSGVLVQEREVIAIDALLRLGRRAVAEARAERFHRQFPGSVHGRRIDVLLGVPDALPPDHN